MSNLNFEPEAFEAFPPTSDTFDAHEGPTTLAMRPVRARILWPALGFPAVISPQPGSAAKPFETDASRCICALILSDKNILTSDDVAQYLRIVPWSQRARRRIAPGEPGSFKPADIEVLSDVGGKRLSMSQNDAQSDAVIFGGTADGSKNPIVVALSRDVRQFYADKLPYLYEIRVSEAASAKLAEGQYHLFWNNHAPDGTPSDEMELLLEHFAKPQRQKLGSNWARQFNFFVDEYKYEYGALHLPYNRGGSQGRPLTEVLHPVFVQKFSSPVRIGHVTDTHVDVRWDVFEENLRIKGKLASSRFNNCNKNFARIFNDANKQSDVVLLTGDLIDYGRGHIGPDPGGRYVETLGRDDYYHEDRNWFLFYYLLASGKNYCRPAYTILGNHDWRLNPYPPFSPGHPEVEHLFDAANFSGKRDDLVELLRIAHGPGHQQNYSYALETESFFKVVGRGISAFFGYLTQPGSPVVTDIKSIKWYLLLINPFLNYSFTLPSGQQLLMLDFAKDESLQNPDKPFAKNWLGFGPRAAKCPTALQKWLLDQFMSAPGRAKLIGVHVPPMGPFPEWTDDELIKGVKTYHRTSSESLFKYPDGRKVRMDSHPMYAIRPPDAPYGVAADYGSMANEKDRNSFITSVSDASHGIRLVLSGHIHRRGVLTTVRDKKGWMLRDLSSINLQNLHPPSNLSPGSLGFPVFVNTTSAGPRGHQYGVSYTSMEPGWSWMSLAQDGNIVRLTHVPPRFLPRPAPSHELEYMPSDPSRSPIDDRPQPSYRRELMSSDLNFEAESFSGYQPPQSENYEQLEQEHHFVHGGHFGGGMFRGRGRGFGRGSWWRRNRFSSGGSTQDQQSIGWAQNCLAQITGSQVSQTGRMGHHTRRAIRKFQMQNQLQPTGRLDQNTMSALQQQCGDQDSGGGDQGGGGDDNESRYSAYEFDQAPLPTAPPPAYTPRNCDNNKFPSPSTINRALTSGNVKCPTRADAQRLLAPIIKNAVAMLDNTIAELTHARESACRGEPLGWPNMSDTTACWLKYKLGVCIDDPATWTAGTFQSRSVAEVLRRLIRPRNLLAGNEIQYVCLPNCPAGVIARSPVLDDNGRCIPGTPPTEIRLCPLFWTDQQAPFRELTLIHEAVHLTHCGDEDDTVGVSIGSPECLAQFVAATNRKPVNPLLVRRCGFTNRCGTVPKHLFSQNCGAKTGVAKTLPDWKP